MRLMMAGTIGNRLRLWSGLVLFAFALTHFINHALGLWSLDVMMSAQAWRVAVTRSPLGTVVLAAAIVTHAFLALGKLAGLRQLRLPRAEIVLGASGLLIPFFLMPHLFEAGLFPRTAGVIAKYPVVLNAIWPASMLRQSALLILVWFHGCLGLHFWLRGENWWRKASHGLAALAALVPTLALLGVVAAGREAERINAVALVGGPLSKAMREVLGAQAQRADYLVLGLVLLALVIAVMRYRAFRPPARIAVSYIEGPTVLSPLGPTLLEISRSNRVPHLSVCGGKARCSTCRVKVLAGADMLEAPEEAEMRLLRRIGAPADVRLACQIHPRAPIAVARLLRPQSQGGAPSVADLEAGGVDRVAAVLFVDIRGFTRLSQAKLAYDVVYILNSFFAGIGRSIESAGGRVDKYIGDGVMAVFEHPEGLTGASRSAVEAVAAIDRELTVINLRLADEIAEPLRLAMGLHGGRLVFGRIGWGEAALPTIIGPAVNVASRLESLAKSRNVELAISRECAVAAGLPIGSLEVEDVSIRGVNEQFPVVLVHRIEDLALEARGNYAVSAG